ncbi:hypothetical protein AB2762_11880 [Acinetobacter indicus]
MRPKQLQPYGKALKLDSARHCQTLAINAPDCRVEKKDSLADWAQRYTVATPKGACPDLCPARCVQPEPA